MAVLHYDWMYLGTILFVTLCTWLFKSAILIVFTWFQFPCTKWHEILYLLWWWWKEMLNILGILLNRHEFSPKDKTINNRFNQSTNDLDIPVRPRRCCSPCLRPSRTCQGTTLQWWGGAGWARSRSPGPMLRSRSCRWRSCRDWTLLLCGLTSWWVYDIES